MTLNANALSTLDEAKTELDIPLATTAEDTRVEGFVNAASDFIENATNRKLIAQAFTHYFDGSETKYLLAYEFPVNSVTTIHIDDHWVWGAATELVAAERMVLRDVLFVRRCGHFHYKSALNTKVVYNAGYAVIPSDLHQACLELVKYFYYSRNDKRMGKTSQSKVNESISFTDGFPTHIMPMIAPHVRAAYIASQLEGFPWAADVNGTSKPKGGK